MARRAFPPVHSVRCPYDCIGDPSHTKTHTLSLFSGGWKGALSAGCARSSSREAARREASSPRATAREAGARSGAPHPLRVYSRGAVPNRAAAGRRGVVAGGARCRADLSERPLLRRPQVRPDLRSKRFSAIKTPGVGSTSAPTLHVSWFTPPATAARVGRASAAGRGRRPRRGAGRRRRRTGSTSHSRPRRRRAGCHRCAIAATRRRCVPLAGGRTFLRLRSNVGSAAVACSAT
jgi:hypothetical protein